MDCLFPIKEIVILMVFDSQWALASLNQLPIGDWIGFNNIVYYE